MTFKPSNLISYAVLALAGWGASENLDTVHTVILACLLAYVAWNIFVLRFAVRLAAAEIVKLRGGNNGS
jgi:cation transporter-like permease